MKRLARSIVERIGGYIMEGKSMHVDESTIPLVRATQSVIVSIGNLFKKLFGNSQNVVVNGVMPIITRCEIATWNSDLGLDKQIETDILDDKGDAVKWHAHNVMTKTGIVDAADPSVLWYRDGYHLDCLMPIHATTEEVKLRNYKHHKIIEHYALTMGEEEQCAQKLT